MEGKEAVDINATTQFVSDANIAEASVTKPLSIEGLFYKSSTTESVEEIKDFLRKPRILKNGTLGALDTVSTFPKMLIPQDAVGVPIIANKLAGYLGIRCTTVLTWHINANRFQQGRYMLTFVSTAGANTGSASGVAWVDAHANTLRQRTTLPRVELDINCDTQGVLKIPFVSALNFYPIKSLPDSGNFGVARIFPYVAVATPAGSTSCGYTIWVHFEDVELIGPASPQSGLNATSKEQNSHGVGPVTAALANTTRALNIWADVPLISSYVQNASWFTDMMRRTTDVFGWSKPDNLSHLTRVNRVPGVFASNVDNSDQALPISLSTKNQVNHLAGFSGTDVDEMDFSHIATIPAFEQFITWDTSITAGTSIFFKEVGPKFYSSQRTILGGVVVTDFSPFAFVAQNFEYWRGSIVFNFKIIKTEFHSGRLAICFFPHGKNINSPVDNMAGADYVHREIVDIRECNSVTVTVPYINATPYCSNLDIGSIGRLIIFVIDPLVAPATVSSSITLICEVGAGPDVEFAVPARNPFLTPAMNCTPQSGISVQPKRDDCNLVSTCIGSSNVVFDNFANSGAAIGERISSFRTLLKKAALMGATGLPNTALVSYLNVIPYSIGVWNNIIGSPSPTNSGDLYGCLASCYGLSRGGLRFRLEFSGVTTPQTRLQKAYTYQLLNTQQQFLTYGVTDLNSAHVDQSVTLIPTVTFNMAVEPFAELQVPQYSSTHSRANAAHIINTAFLYDPGDLATRTVFSFNYPDGFLNSQLYRSGADDLNMGQFISIPPMLTVLSAAF